MVVHHCDANKNSFVRFEVFTMKNAVFWDVASCRSCVNRRSSETSVHTRSTRPHIPEDGSLQEYFDFSSIKFKVSLERLLIYSRTKKLQFINTENVPD
jgi:hypothetical protein